MTEASAVSFPQIFEEIIAARQPSQEMFRATFDAIFSGGWTPVQIAALMVALRVRGEDEVVVSAAIEAMRAVMIPLSHSLPKVLDTCGTGGDGQATINISTAAAFLVAGAGLPVAKHGNRSVSSRTGSADVIEALGLPLELAAEHHAYLLKKARITFLYAPAHHPALRYCGAARRELGVRTLFNALGPIANPALATHQLIGAYEDRLRPALAGALGRLGSRAAWVVRGEDGLDEVSPFGPTRVTELAEGRLTERVITPEDFGIRPSPPGAIKGGDAADNAARILSILRGQKDPARDAVVLNAAAAIAIGMESTRPADLPAAAAAAEQALRSGAALRVFETWHTLAHAAV